MQRSKIPKPKNLMNLLPSEGVEARKNAMGLFLGSMSENTQVKYHNFIGCLAGSGHGLDRAMYDDRKGDSLCS